MSTVFQSISDAVEPAVLEQLAYGTLSEQIPTDAPQVQKFAVLARGLSLPLVFTGYTKVMTGGGYQVFLSDQTVSFGSTYILGPTTPLMAQLPYYQGQYIVGRTMATGGIVAAFQIKPPDPTKAVTHVILQDDLLRPNSIPVPDTLVNSNTVPLGTPRFLVGFGSTSGKSIDGTKTIDLDVLHEQYWRPSPTSFPLAPGEDKKILLTHMTGLSDTSSSEHSFEATLGLSVSGGWGPVSASLSASFSDSLTTSHSRTLTQQTISTTEVHLTNSTDSPQLIVYWELVDTYTLVESTNFPSSPTPITQISPVIRAVVECIAAPVLVRRYVTAPNQVPAAYTQPKTDGKLSRRRIPDKIIVPTAKVKAR
jgi:hypothetical protein